MLGARFLRQALDGLGAIDFLEATKKSLIYGTGSELARPCSGQACSLHKNISTRLVCYPSSFKNYMYYRGSETTRKYYKTRFITFVRNYN